MKIFLLTFIFCSLQTLASTTNKLTLYFIPSPLGMDWSSPSTLAMSALKNRLSFKSRFMGHVFVELDCNGDKQLTGMVGKRFDYLTQLFIHERGLGVLFHSFDGGLEEKAEVEDEIKDLAQEGERINFVRYKLNQGQCLRAQTYLKEYRDRNVGRYYGLANRPLYAEGSGCSAFGASFVEVVGLADQEIKDSWSQTVNIPMEFAGPPLKQEGVNFLKLMMNASRWAKEGELHRKLTFWSPDRMFQWVQNKVRETKSSTQFTTVDIDKAKGIEIDKSYLPAPEGPIWQQHLDPYLIKDQKTSSTIK